MADQTRSSSPSTFSPPSSILIIGSGVFGLSTAFALARRNVFSGASITVVDRATDPSSGGVATNPVFPARDASSVDTSRIIRPDYADPAYSKLAAEAQHHWRKSDSPNDLGAEGRYTESGLVIVANGPPPAEKKSSPTSTDGVHAQPKKKAKKTGMDYVYESWENIVALSAKDPQLASRIRKLPNAEAIREAVGTGGTSGSWGYLNGCSGWANAEKCMSWLYEQVLKTGRVKFVAGTVTRLVQADEANGTKKTDGADGTTDELHGTVTGVELSDGRTLSADLVVLATGAWTSSLLDIASQATATGQVLAYMDISEEEQEQLGKMPTLLNLSTGLFIIPPANRVLKVARHAYGYVSPTELPVAPLSATPLPYRWTASYPIAVEPGTQIPDEGITDLRRALREMVPIPEIHDRPFTRTRLCWYTDTASGDFLICHHPNYRGLFVATGGSGHGFKFLPVIGEKIADAIEGRCPAEFKDRWAWRPAKQDPGFSYMWNAVITEDGSRGGEPGCLVESHVMEGDSQKQVLDVVVEVD